MMKKLTILLLPLFLLLFCSISFFTNAYQNDIKLTYVESTINGDPTVFEDVSYHFNINRNGKEWLVKGKGMQLTSTYVREKPQRHIDGMILATLIPTINDKDIVETQQDCSEDFCTDVAEVKGLEYQIEYTYVDENEQMMTHRDDKKYRIETIDKQNTFVAKYEKYDEGDSSSINLQNVSKDGNNETAEFIQPRDSLQFIGDQNCDDTQCYIFINKDMTQVDLPSLNAKPTSKFGGIYVFDKELKLKQVLPMDMIKKNIMSLHIFQDTIMTVVKDEVKHEYSLCIYSKDFTLLNTLKLPNTEAFYTMKVNKDQILLSTMEKNADENGNRNFTWIYEYNKGFKLLDKFPYQENNSTSTMQFLYKNKKIYFFRPMTIIQVTVVGKEGMLLQTEIEHPKTYNDNRGLFYNEDTSFMSVLTTYLLSYDSYDTYGMQIDG